tara:strand:- start:102 stop:725 length:624 start_codon:yes stop_codon:yes gene_type:complete
MKTPKIPTNYLLSIYRSFWANYEDTWGKNHPDWFRPHGRDGYRLFGAGNIQSGFVSEQALYDKLEGKKMVADHYLSPQFASGVPLHFYDKYLCPQSKDPRRDNGDRDNFDNFCEYMNRLRVVTRVTSKENKELSKLTDTKSGDFPVVYIPTNKKYDHLGIKLYEFDITKKLSNNVIEDILETQFPLVASEVLHFPADLIEYEKDFLI